MANPVSPLVNRRTTLKDALSMMLDADVQAAVVVDRSGAVQGIMTVDRVARLMREGEHGRSFGIFGDVADETEAPTTSRPPLNPPRPPPPGPEHGRGRARAIHRLGLDLHASRRHRRCACCQHIELTLIPVAAGMIIAVAAGHLVGPPTPRLRPDHRHQRLLYTIPSIAAFAIVRPIFGLSLLTAIIPLTTYTLLILVRNNVSGLHAVPPDAIEAATGMGYTDRQRLRRGRAAVGHPADDDRASASDRDDGRPGHRGGHPR